MATREKIRIKDSTGEKQLLWGWVLQRRLFLPEPLFPCYAVRFKENVTVKSPPGDRCSWVTSLHSCLRMTALPCPPSVLVK
jgi:hypothetical protein